MYSADYQMDTSVITAVVMLGGLIIGLGVASRHYLGMRAIRVQDTLSYDPLLVATSVVIAVIAAPGAPASTSGTASAAAFLLPLIMGLSSIGFIFCAVIALSPTAAEIVEEHELMRRIGRVPKHAPTPPARGPAPDGSGAPRPAEPGSLFRSASWDNDRS